MHIRATASMTLADKAVTLDLERVDLSSDSDCELLEVKATLLSGSGAIHSARTTPRPRITYHSHKHTTYHQA